MGYSGMFKSCLLVTIVPLVIAATWAPARLIDQPDAARTFEHVVATDGPEWLTRCRLSAARPVGTTLQVIQVRRPTRGSTIDVRVRSDRSPVVLLLASEKPAIWRVDAGASADIRGIMLVGRVALLQGVDAQVPISRCDPPKDLISSGLLVDQVADSLVLPVETVQRGSVDEGYDITSRPYPNLQNNRYDTCRVDFDYGGENITKHASSSANECRTFCDKFGPLNADQGRVTCVVNGRPAWAYPAKLGYLAMSCRFIASDGRNIRSYPALSAYECLDTVCYTGVLFTSSDVSDRWESRCLFNGRTIKRFRLKPWPWLQEPYTPPEADTSADRASAPIS